MTDTITPIPVVYDLPAIPDLAAKYATLTSAATKEEYEAVRLGIAELRQLRGAVEKRRVELKAEALRYGREVDSVAKSLTEQLEAIEAPLKLLKAGVDEEKARAKEAARAAAAAAEEARVRAQLEAERQRLAEEAAEREELARERAAIEAQKLQAERERLAAERALLEIETQRAKVAEGERLKLEQAAREEAEQEREALAAERAEIEAQRAELARGVAAKMAAEQAEAARAAELARQEAVKPDIEKVKAFAQRIRDVNETYPQVDSPVARDLVSLALHELEQVALALDGIGGGT